MNYQILQGDNRETLKTIPDNSIDAIITDPPYGIDFLGKAWDANTGALETYQECLRVLKPGGHILAFSAARTYHHLAVTLEAAGFEIRDQIMWIYSSGFPKSQDVGKGIQRAEKTKDLNEWLGWGTALKPAHEPIALARKPTKLSYAKNCQTHGVGALHIDATRIPYAGPGDKPVPPGGKARLADDNEGWHKNNTGWKTIDDPQINEIGRFPSNVIGEIPDYQKYFYCPKVSRAERHIGYPKAKGMYEIAREHGYTLAYDDPNDTSVGYMVDTQGNKVPDLVLQKLVEQHGGGNNHPTVKPIELMKYLIKLVTPPGGTVLDPFNGSGSTGCAAVELGHPYIGCELDPAYVDIAHKRIQAWNQPDNTFTDLFE